MTIEYDGNCFYFTNVKVALTMLEFIDWATRKGADRNYIRNKLAIEEAITADAPLGGSLMPA